LGRKGRPRFKGRNQIDSLEGQSNRQGLRWKDGNVLWVDLCLPALIDPADPLTVHALSRPIRRVRIVRRRIRGRVRVSAQLICQGSPYRDPDRPIGKGTAGLDPGPRTFGVFVAGHGFLVDLGVGLSRSVASLRRLDRRIQRKVRANNPDALTRSGTFRQGFSARKTSASLRRDRLAYAELHRRAKAQRKSLHGQLANRLLETADTIRIEQNPFGAFKRNFGRSVRIAAPARFVAELARKAANAGGRVELVPNYLALSRLCHGCGRVARKPLSLREHRCTCGVGPVHRDLYSAWLVSLAHFDPEGSTWGIDADKALGAWSDVGPHLSAASVPLAIGEAVSLLARIQAVSDASRSVSPESGSGTERLADEASAKAGEARDVVGSAEGPREPAGSPQGNVVVHATALPRPVHGRNETGAVFDKSMLARDEALGNAS
jgi:transposase